LKRLQGINTIVTSLKLAGRRADEKALARNEQIFICSHRAYLLCGEVISEMLSGFVVMVSLEVWKGRKPLFLSKPGIITSRCYSGLALNQY
jgi:hypothetical protein